MLVCIYVSVSLWPLPARVRPKVFMTRLLCVLQLLSVLLDVHFGHYCRVLKPPGGGCSDIFGTTAEQKPRERDVSNENCPPSQSIAATGNW